MPWERERDVPAPMLYRPITLSLQRMSQAQRVSAMTAFAISLLHLADKYDPALSKKQRAAIRECIEHLHAGDAYSARFAVDEVFFPRCYANDMPHAVYVLQSLGCAASSYAAAFAITNAIGNGVPKDQVQALIALHLT